MNTVLRAALAPFKERATGEVIFARRDGSPYRSIRTAFATACRRAGYQVSRPTSCATRSQVAS
jgi:hypothetical protein